FFFFSSRRRHTRCLSDWSSDVCSSDLVVTEAPGVVSIRIAGRNLDRLQAQPGQFFQWRFLNRWWTAHPFSLSEAPDGRSFRITVDRKSTRLNSSHLGISYAVFCLKKKT